MDNHRMFAQADAENIADGERIPMAPKELGSTEVYPQSLKHNNNGRFIVVCGDGEYIIYTSQVHMLSLSSFRVTPS